MISIPLEIFHYILSFISKYDFNTLLNVLIAFPESLYIINKTHLNCMIPLAIDEICDCPIKDLKNLLLIYTKKQILEELGYNNTYLSSPNGLKFIKYIVSETPTYILRRIDIQKITNIAEKLVIKELDTIIFNRLKHILPYGNLNALTLKERIMIVNNKYDDIILYAIENNNIGLLKLIFDNYENIEYKIKPITQRNIFSNIYEKYILNKKYIICINFYFSNYFKHYDFDGYLRSFIMSKIPNENINVINYFMSFPKIKNYFEINLFDGYDFTIDRFEYIIENFNELNLNLSNIKFTFDSNDIKSIIHYIKFVEKIISLDIYKKQFTKPIIKTIYDNLLLIKKKYFNEEQNTDKLSIYNSISMLLILINNEMKIITNNNNYIQNVIKNYIEYVSNYDTILNKMLKATKLINYLISKSNIFSINIFTNFKTSVIEKLFEFEKNADDKLLEINSIDKEDYYFTNKRHHIDDVNIINSFKLSIDNLKKIIL